MSELNKNSEDPAISIVIPLLNEAQSLQELADQIDEALNGTYSYEILFVDDGSNDDSWEVIRQISESHEQAGGIKLHRNYGKSTALQAGFDRVRGRFIITMDADLQDDPFEIPELVQMLNDGYELVSGWKKERHDPLTKTIPSKFFNYVTSLVTGIHLHDFNCGLKAYRREVVDRIQLYGELHRYVPMLAHWEGFTKIGEKVVQHHPRKHGKTKFGVSRFFKGFLDLVTLLFVHNYLQRPMHFFGTLGLVFIFIGGLVNVYLAVLKIFFNQPLSNRPLLLLGILLLMLGAQFFSIGFLGELFNKNADHHITPNVESEV